MFKVYDMKDEESTNVISEDIALKLCNEIRDEKPVKLFSQCWGCLKFSKEDPAKMCFYDPPKNRGCTIINKKFDEQKR
jgi:hypothetical protein